MTTTKMNPDLLKERVNSTIDIEQMKSFIGELMYKSVDNYRMMTQLRKSCFWLNFFYIQIIL